LTLLPSRPNGQGNTMEGPPPPPAYTIFDDFQEDRRRQYPAHGSLHPAGFIVPPPPPPLPISIPNGRREVHSREDSYILSDGVVSPPYETSYGPSSSYGSTTRRPLPMPPPPVPAGSVPAPPNGLRISTHDDPDGSRGGAHSQSQRIPTTPPSGHPPHILPSPSHHALSPERLLQELPPTPPSSGSRRRRSNRESQTSFQSLSSSISPVYSPSSFNTDSLPPWAVPHQSEAITRDPTVVPRNNQGIRVEINQDPGRVVPSKLGNFDLCMHKGHSHTAPSYGRGESVTGYVDLKVHDRIARIDVTVCICSPSFNELNNGPLAQLAVRLSTIEPTD